MIRSDVEAAWRLVRGRCVFGVGRVRVVRSDVTVRCVRSAGRRGAGRLRAALQHAARRARAPPLAPAGRSRAAGGGHRYRSACCSGVGAALRAAARLRAGAALAHLLVRLGREYAPRAPRRARPHPARHLGNYWLAGRPCSPMPSKYLAIFYTSCTFQ